MHLTMHLDQLRHCLESYDEARPVLHEWNLHDFERGQHNLQHIANVISDGSSTRSLPLLFRRLDR